MRGEQAHGVSVFEDGKVKKKLPIDVFISENPMGSLLLLLIDRHAVFIQVFRGNIHIIVPNHGIAADAGL